MKPPPNGFVSNRVLRINVGFLLNESLGSSRDIDFDVPQMSVADDLRLAYLRGQIRLSRTTEGILVQGTLHTAIEAECRRCLEAIELPLSIDLQELFSTEQTHSEFTLGEDAILDLTPLLREEAIVNTPQAPLCKADCAGLCPTCGHNRNLGPCQCEIDDIDPRLAILLQLKDRE